MSFFTLFHISEASMELVSGWRGVVLTTADYLLRKYLQIRHKVDASGHRRRCRLSGPWLPEAVDDTPLHVI